MRSSSVLVCPCTTNLYSTAADLWGINTTPPLDIFISDIYSSPTAVSPVSQDILMGFQLYNGFSPAVLFGRTLRKRVWITKRTGLEIFLPTFTTYGDRLQISAPESYSQRNPENDQNTIPTAEALYPYNLKRGYIRGLSLYPLKLIFEKRIAISLSLPPPPPIRYYTTVLHQAWAWTMNQWSVYRDTRDCRLSL